MQQAVSNKPRSDSRGKTTAFALGISKMPMTKDSVEPLGECPKKRPQELLVQFLPPRGEGSKESVLNQFRLQNGSATGVGRDMLLG